MRSKLLLAASLILGSVTVAEAQVTVTPFIGTMIPMRSMLVDTGGTAGFRMQAHTIYGMRFSKPMSPSLGLELALGAGSGTLEAVGTDVIDLKTSVYFADARARLRIAGDDDAQLGAIVGAGWTQFSSGLFDAAHEADEDTRFKGTITGMVGLGFNARLSNRVSVSVDALDRIHEQGVDAPGLNTDQYVKKMQHDVTVAAGLSFPLGR